MCDCIGLWWLTMGVQIMSTKLKFCYYLCLSIRYCISVNCGGIPIKFCTKSVYFIQSVLAVIKSRMRKSVNIFYTCLVTFFKTWLHVYILIYCNTTVRGLAIVLLYMTPEDTRGKADVSAESCAYRFYNIYVTLSMSCTALLVNIQEY